MGYHILPQNGDSISVPQLVVKNLNNGREDYFRIALYVLATGDCEAASVAAALQIRSEALVQNALAFWQGAGLLGEDPQTSAPELKKRTPRLTTREVLMHSGQNPELAVLMQEAQRIFGEVISQTGCSILATMYVSEEMPLDYLLLGLSYLASQGYTAQRLGAVERKMLSWKEDGIETAQQLENYIELLELRRARYEEVARLMKCDPETFSQAEKAKIDVWYETYRYTETMISFALGQIGEGDSEKKTVKYINGVLRQWYGKGMRQPRDVLARQQGSNALPGGRVPAGREDLLQQRKGHVPKFRLEED